MSVDKYKLYYFDVKGRAEVTRLLFHYAGVEFDDIRVTTEEWEKLKPSTPFGQLPVLEVNGKQIAQSQTIGRYVARKCGLAGTSEAEEAEVDSYNELISDILRLLLPLEGERDKAKQELIIDDAVKKMTPWLQVFEKKLTDHKFLVGVQVTKADLALMYWTTSSYLTKCAPNDLFTGYPRIQEHNTRMLAIPRIKEYIAKRPETAY